MIKLPVLPLGLAGLVSGVLHAVWMLYGAKSIDGAGGVVSSISYFGAAGIIYAIIVGAVLRHFLKFEPWRWALFVVGAGLSYAAAVFIALKIYQQPAAAEPINYVAGGVAGFVGAALLCGVSALLFAPLRSVRAAALGTAAGTIIGFGLTVAIEYDEPISPMIFFGLWQAAYAVASTRTS